jgi:hypothetical protein
MINIFSFIHIKRDMPVCNCKDGAISKLLTNGFLNNGIGFHVNLIWVVKRNQRTI